MFSRCWRGGWAVSMVEEEGNYWRVDPEDEL